MIFNYNRDEGSDVMKRYAIVHKLDELSLNIYERLRKELDDIYTYDEENPELVISVGGDGSMLYSVHKYEHMLDEVSFIGLHSGTLGFLTDYQKEELDVFINDLKTKEIEYYNRHLLQVKIGDEIYHALNEFRIENNMRAQVLDVYINDEYLETFRGNGLCVSTTSGSTAYNKSLGGAILYSDVGMMQLSEIAGIHHNAYRSLGSSLVLDKKYTIRFESLDYKHAVLGIDHLVLDLKQPSSIEVKVAMKTARFAELKQVSLIERLKRAYL